MAQQYRIERLGHRGDGVADGPVFVARALPGELLEGEVEDGRIARPQIIEPSPKRVKAPCRHYNGCGGCALLHASDEFVADWKTAAVRDALAGQGLTAPIRRMHTSPPGSRRRATLSGRRTKSGTLVGFHGRGSAMLSEVTECQLLASEILAGLPALHGLVAAGATRKGELSLHVTRSTAGLDVAVQGGKALDRDLMMVLAGLAGDYDLARLTWDGEPIAERRPPSQIFGRAVVTPPSGAFLQATEEGEAALAASVSEALDGAATVADLFAGCGTFALRLAEEAEVHAIEGDHAMTAALDRGWRAATGLKLVTAETRDLLRRPLLPDELRRFDGVVIDPPRAGAEAQTRALAEAQVPVIAAVSCNPVTFARDAKLLGEAGYSTDWIDVVDQFRWSPHVELAARLRLSHIRG